MLCYTGLECFRQRVVLSFTSCKRIEISSEKPFQPHHESILSILSTISSGGKTKLSSLEAGQKLELTPGPIKGGNYIFKLPAYKEPFYYLEPLIFLAPISSGPFKVELKGIINKGEPNRWQNLYSDPFVSSLSVYNKIYQLVGIVGSVKATKNYSIIFECIPKRKFEPISYLSPSPISRIRGSIKVISISPAIAHLVANLIKTYFSRLSDNVWIVVDCHKRNEQRPQPFLGLSMIAENKCGVTFTVNRCISPECGLGSIGEIEKIANPRSIDNNVSIKDLAEDMGISASNRLLSEIIIGGWVDSAHQHLLLFFMALGGDHKLGKVSLR